MEDLIARATKYAKSAGRTGAAHYSAAGKDERLSHAMSWTNAALTAAVGTSIFAQWIEANPLPFGLAAMLAGALSAIQAASKIDQRGETHRTAGAEYGRLRRRGDMLRLRLEARDLTREEGLAALDGLAEELSELATQFRALPDRIYNPARAAFDREHADYAEDVSAHLAAPTPQSVHSGPHLNGVTQSRHADLSRNHAEDSGERSHYNR